MMGSPSPGGRGRPVRPAARALSRGRQLPGEQRSARACGSTAGCRRRTVALGGSSRGMMLMMMNANHSKG